MPRNKKFERKCAICQRSKVNERMLGSLIHTKMISAHYNCVLFSPILPDATSMSAHAAQDSIGGIKSRFIRGEGTRAVKLVIFFSFPFRIYLSLFA